MPGSDVGHILWTDLTVPHAEAVRDFYAAVVGWTFEPVGMSGCQDYMMVAPGPFPDRPKERPFHPVGICHARGGNAKLPAQWLNYFGVADLDVARAKVTELGGALVTDIQPYGQSRYCVIEDPAGAVCALFENVPDGE